MLPLLVFALLTGEIRAHVIVRSDKPLKRFVPQVAFGAGLDGHEHGDIASIFTPNNIEAMQSVGLKSLSYRLRTELGIEAWHWNPEGRWSDSKRNQGYWISSRKVSKPIEVSFGYSLPRRGSTFDQANNRGYSRIDDGDLSTFWKSNPYLDQRFTGEPNAKHPQWIVIDFGKSQKINAAKIRWGTPYAVRYRFEYWDGAPRVDEVDPPSGDWKPFPTGSRTNGRGGVETLALAARPVAAEYVRIWLDESSNTAPLGSKDVRDRLGFAIRELGVGRFDKKGRFQDLVIHRKDSRQTELVASSTDPWHRASDRDRDVEQPGFDLIERSGLTSHLPMLIPVPVLFGVPEDAANELAWLKARGYPVRGVEMGEEPDGQMTLPEDYAALYLQVADRLRAVQPGVTLGGPCFQTTQHEFRDWPDPHGQPWLRRFFAYLKSRNRSQDLGFFSFEWYPFDDVAADPVPQLLSHDELFSKTMDRLMAQGLTHDIPWMITEYGYSAFAGPSEVEMPGAILNADIVGRFLTLGGDTSFLYGYEPGEVIKEKTGAWGNLMDLQGDPSGGAPTRLCTYYSAWLLTHAWCGDQAKPHELCETNVLQDKKPWVDAYSVIRPDGRLGIMLLNRNPKANARVDLELPLAMRSRPGVLYQYGSRQYEWKRDGANGRAIRSLPPSRVQIKDPTLFSLPPYSLTVLVVGG